MCDVRTPIGRSVSCGHVRDERSLRDVACDDVACDQGSLGDEEAHRT
jgi:hypothetical protein